MAEVLGTAMSTAKSILGFDDATIDNWTFRLFYKITTTFLMACAIVSGSRQFFGDPIACEVVNIYKFSFFWESLLSKMLCSISKLSILQ